MINLVSFILYENKKQSLEEYMLKKKSLILLEITPKVLNLAFCYFYQNKSFTRSVKISAQYLPPILRYGLQTVTMKSFSKGVKIQYF